MRPGRVHGLVDWPLLGSVANLIVVSQAEARARVGFWEYARVGAPITLLTLAWGAWWLQR